MAQSLSVRALTLASQLVLAWLLSPADFGAIGLANSVAALAAIVSNLGLDEVLLQRQRSVARWAASAFWMSLGLAFTGMILLLLASSTIAQAYHTPKLSGMIVILALSMPLGALSAVPLVKARADLKFSLIAVYNTSELGLLQISTIALAWTGFGVYSFVIPVPLLAIAKALVFWRYAPVSLTGRLRLVRFTYLARNGLTVFASRVITEAVGQGDYITLGLMTTDTIVGIYYFAFRLAAQPVRMLAGTFQNVLFPVLAQIRSDRPRQVASALHAAQALSYVVMPLCFMQAALADPALRLLAAPRWRGAIVLVQILSLGLPFDATSWMAGALLNARGEFQRALVFSCVLSPVFFLGVYLGARIDSALGVAVAVSLYYAVVTPIYSMMVFRAIITPWRLASNLFGTPALLAGGSMGVAYAVSLVPAVADFQFLRCVLIVVLGGGLYITAFSRLRPQLFHELVQRLGVSRIAQAPGLRRLQNWVDRAGPPKPPSIIGPRPNE